METAGDGSSGGHQGCAGALNRILFSGRAGFTPLCSWTLFDEVVDKAVGRCNLSKKV